MTKQEALDYINSLLEKARQTSMERKGFDIPKSSEAETENKGYAEEELEALVADIKKEKELNNANKTKKEGIELDFDGCYDDFGYNKYLAKKGK